MNLIFWLGLIFLIIFSIIDVRTRKLSNGLIIAFLLVGTVLGLFTHNWLSIAVGMALMTIVTVSLWCFNTIGAADSKLLIALVPYLPFIGIANLLAMLWLFFVIFGMLGTAYGLIYIKMFQDRGQVPLIPIITLTYIVVWIIRIV